MNGDGPWKFRLEAQRLPPAYPGAPERAIWVVHTAVKPEPGLELEFNVTPMAQGETDD